LFTVFAPFILPLDERTFEEHSGVSKVETALRSASLALIGVPSEAVELARHFLYTPMAYSRKWLSLHHSASPKRKRVQFSKR